MVLNMKAISIFRRSGLTFRTRVSNITGLPTSLPRNTREMSCNHSHSEAFNKVMHTSPTQTIDLASATAVNTNSNSTSGLALSFHKRQLPPSLIALSSPAGKKLFKEALASGGMESYFALSEQFVTQSEPSFCALSSLAMVLNALSYDPKKNWKGSWRWVSEETLQCETMSVCGHSLDKVRLEGMNFSEFESLARCHGVPIRSFRVFDDTASKEKSKMNIHTRTQSACNNCTHHHNHPQEQRDTEKIEMASSVDQFRQQVRNVSASDRADTFIVVNFSRKELDQTGEGHFSPVGGYHVDKDLVLIMDVARFKYPPFWVPLERLWSSMSVWDKQTGQSRGYFILSLNGS